MKRQLSALSLILIAGLLTACGGSQSSADTTAAFGDTSGDSSDTAPAVTEPIETSSLPDEYDLGGYEFRIYKQQQDKVAWSLQTFGTMVENGDVMNDVFYTRNVTMSEKYNFTIKEIESSTTPVSTVRNSVLAGDDVCDVMMAAFNNERSSYDGTYYNLYDIPNLDLERSWWNQSMIDALSMNGKLYFISGDIVASDDDGLMISIWNRALSDDWKHENLYDTVREGKWTIDRKISLLREVTADLDNNGTYDTNDNIPLLYANNAAAYPYFAASDVMLFTPTADGFEFTGADERAVNAFEKIQTMLSDLTLSYNWGNIKENSSEVIVGMIDNKQVLFQDVALHFVRRNLRDLNIDYGILPLPKLDETQENYVSMLNESMSHLLVPATVVEIEKAGFILEALASASKDITTTYYDTCIKGKYARDDESLEMLEIATENVIFDLGFIYNWGGLGNTLINAVMGDANYASLLASYRSAAVTAMEEYIEVVK